MTEQSPNDVLQASSFLQGHNAEYIKQRYARDADDLTKPLITSRVLTTTINPSRA